eukprot:Gb_35373 [translate_table: standard]
MYVNYSVSRQAELLDPAVKGTLNALKAAHKAKVKRVVVTSSISAISPSPKWPADVPKDENCWTDLDYCKENGVRYWSCLGFDWTICLLR